MNANLVKLAMEKALNPHVLVNLVSRRVRQLNAGGGGANQPMIADTTNLCAADMPCSKSSKGKWISECPSSFR